MKPLPYQQFQELLRWEIEPYMARNRSRRIGSILVGRGYLKPADLETLLAQIESQEGKKPRLGEAAVAAGLITPPQLSEGLALQKSEPTSEGAIVCGWRPLDNQPDGGKWPWLVVAMSDRLRKEAHAAFASRGLQLSGVYPLVGGACASLNGQCNNPCAIFEYQAGYLSYVRYENYRIVNARTVFTQESKNPLRACMDLFEDRVQNVWLAGRWPDLAAAQRDLESSLGRPCQPITSIQTSVPGLALPSVAGMLGTALHSLQCVPLSSAAFVPASDPRPQIWRNRWMLASAAGILVAAGLFIGAERLRDRNLQLAARLEANNQLAAAQTQVTRVNSECQQAENTITQLRETLQRKRQRIEELLAGLQSRYSNEIMIRSIQTASTGDINVHGWGLTPQGIQVFIVSLQSELRELTLVESGKPIRQERGWRSLSGYSFEIHLSPGIASEKIR